MENTLIDRLADFRYGTNRIEAVWQITIFQSKDCRKAGKEGAGSRPVTGYLEHFSVWIVPILKLIHNHNPLFRKKAISWHDELFTIRLLTKR
jgi:hypothetical protein